MQAVERLIPNLRKSGLSDKEALVYAALLELGGAYPSFVAGKTGLNRSTTYKVLTELSIKGLVNEIQKGKKLYYQTDRPTKLLRYAKHQIDLANEAYDTVEHVFPEIEGLYTNLSRKAKVLYFEGPEGVLSVYDDHIVGNEPYEMLGFANTNEIIKFLKPDYFTKYRKKKVRLGITTRAILPRGKESEEYASSTYADVPEKFKPQLHFIPSKDFPFKGEITIYGKDKVSIMNLSAHQLSGIIIEDESFNQMMRIIFNLAWRGSK